MKKSWFLISVIFIFSFNLLNSQAAKKKSVVEHPLLSSYPTISKPVDNRDTNFNIIQATQKDPKKDKAEMITKLSDFALDLDDDGLEEKIELYTTAGKSEDGSMIWDDGQNWLLLIEDGDNYYPLFQEYVQLGTVYFNIWYDDKKTPKINVIVSTDAGLNVINYTYDKEQNGYISEKIYDAGNIQFMFSSIPNY
jgi:hypothetical protein